MQGIKSDFILSPHPNPLLREVDSSFCKLGEPLERIMHRFNVCIFFVSVLMSFGGCTSPQLPTQNFEKELATKNIVQKDYPEAEAVVLLRKTHWEMYFDYENKLKTSKTIHVVKKIFRNINKHANIKLLVSGNEKIVHLHARTISPNGSAIELQGSDFFEQIGDETEAVLYSDVKYVKFTFPSVEKNSVVEYILTKQLVDIPFLRDDWIIQEDVPIVENQFVLTVPRALIPRGAKLWQLPWRYKSYNYPELPWPKAERVPMNIDSLVDLVSYTWVAKQIPAFTYEPSMPPPELWLPFVRFSPGFIRTWDDLSEWYYKSIFKPRLKITGAIRTLANSLCEGNETERDRVKAIYEYVQSLRYVAIQIGDGSITPNEPEEILRRKYGDCKDKSILLLSLLKSINTRAEPALVFTKSKGFMDIFFPSWNFNHMIVKATLKNGTELWMDSTAEWHHLGSIPAEVQGIPALVLHEDGTSTVVDLSMTTHDDNQTNMVISVDVKSANETVVQIELLYKGEQAAYIKGEMKDKFPREVEEYCKSIIVPMFLNGRIYDISYGDIEATENRYRLSFKVSVPDLLQDQETLHFMPPIPIIPLNDLSWFENESRVHPIMLPFSTTITQTIKIKYPSENLILKTVPSGMELHSKAMDYLEKVTLCKEGSFEIVKTFVLKQTYIKPTQYPTIQSFLKRIKQKGREQLVFQDNIK
jgi:hypothetical protein